MNRDTIIKNLFQLLDDEAAATESPSFDLLASYVDGDLSQAEEDAIREHLLHCDESADFVLAYAASLEEEIDETAAVSEEAEQTPIVPIHATPSNGSRVALVAIAACLLFTLTTLIFMWPNKQSPSASAMLVQLDPLEEGVLRGPEDENRVNASISHVMLQMYGWDLSPEDNQVILTRESEDILRKIAIPSHDGMITIFVPGSWLKQGMYHVRVENIDGEVRQRYRFLVD